MVISYCIDKCGLWAARTKLSRAVTAKPQLSAKHLPTLRRFFCETARAGRDSIRIKPTITEARRAIETRPCRVLIASLIKGLVLGLIAGLALGLSFEAPPAPRAYIYIRGETYSSGS